MTRSEQTARQAHLHRGLYPFHYPEPRGIASHQWQQDVSSPICSSLSDGLISCVDQVDNRIRFGLRNALNLGIIRSGSTIIAVQGWKGGLGHTNTLRILSVPTDPSDLALQPLGSD